MKKPVTFENLKVYPSVKKELREFIIKAKKSGGDTNISRILHRAFQALREKEK
jgi:hypothetical protein